MQLESADFAPVPPPGDINQTTFFHVRLVPPPGELGEKCVFYSGQFALLCDNMTSSTKKEVNNKGGPIHGHR